MTNASSYVRRGFSSNRRVAPHSHERAETWRRRLVFLLVLVLMSVSLMGSPIHAAALPTLTVKARSTASVDLTFRRNVSVNAVGFSAKGGRSYAGFYLEPLEGRLHVGVGAVYIRAFDATDIAPLEAVGIGPFDPMPPLPLGAPRRLKDDLPWRDEPRVLPAGRYRLHVFADSPVRISVPMRGFTSGPLQARGPSQVSFAEKDITPYPKGIAAPGAITANLEIEIPTRKNITVVAIQSIRHGTMLAEVWPTFGCIGPPEEATCLTEPNNDFGTVYRQGQYMFDTMTRGAVAQKLDEIARYYIPGQNAPGPAVAHFYATTSNLMDRVVVAAMSIGL